ncbi:hypothetical protein BCV71DRAFT_163363, partial [Rhizopus microsporus]
LFTKQHVIYYLDMHHRLQISKTIADSLSFLLNKPPNRRSCFLQTRSFWTTRWPIVCTITYIMNKNHH